MNGAISKKITVLLILLSFAHVSLSAAQQYINFGPSEEEVKKERSEKNAALKEAFRGFEVVFNPTYYRYTEPNLMHLKGFNYRAGAEYTFFLTQNSTWLMHLDYSFAYAKLDYSSRGTGSTKGEKNTIHELRVYTGKTTHFASYPFMYYWGLGFRQLDHDGRKVSTTGHTGYKRRSQYFTATGGTKWLIPLSDNWEFSLKNEISLMPVGKQKSYDATSGSPDRTYDQHFGFNFRLQPNFVLAKHFVVGPYFDWWYVAESEREYEGGGWYSYEPENNTIEYGIILGARF